MDNYSIADIFSLLSKLMDIHGENSFKVKSYSSAAFTIERLQVQLIDIERDNLSSIKGIGENTASKIIEILNTGQLTQLNELINKTPPGIIEMMGIKGIGPKKISTIWKELEIETLGELLYACNENRLTLYKGFGEKTQKNIKESIEFYLNNQGRYLYAQIEEYVKEFEQNLSNNFPEFSFLITGNFKQQSEIIESLEWVTNCKKIILKDFLTSNNFKVVEENDEKIAFKGLENILIEFYFSTNEELFSTLFKTSCSNLFLKNWKTNFSIPANINSEEEIFAKNNIAFIPSFLREDNFDYNNIHQNNFDEIISVKNIKGIIHSHSKWSDGSNSIEEMAHEAIKKGFEYLVISDHSKTAFYAQGLKEEQILAQHKLIDELNEKLKPFTIFKSIESDILNDGSLDYENSVLSTFDLIIASVHSNLKMNEEKAMIRLINAIENPFTSILGHMTGRLLLSRNGYPVNHKKIIDACAANNVVIELNAHPRRLDIDWREIDYALSKNVLISINPDAHSIDSFNDIKYGVLVAQKAKVKPQENLSSYSLEAIKVFIESQKKKRI
jgi:DNA polymerase (family 10)